MIACKALKQLVKTCNSLIKLTFFIVADIITVAVVCLCGGVITSASAQFDQQQLKQEFQTGTSLRK